MVGFDLGETVDVMVRTCSKAKPGCTPGGTFLWMRPAILALALLVCSMACRAGTSTLLNAAIGTALGVGAAAYSRSQGGCYATCTHGTYCNETTGTCEPLPCYGRCDADEVCDERSQACLRRVGPESPLSIEEGVSTSTRSP